MKKQLDALKPDLAPAKAKQEQQQAIADFMSRLEKEYARIAQEESDLLNKLAAMHKSLNQVELTNNLKAVNEAIAKLENEKEN